MQTDLEYMFNLFYLNNNMVNQLRNLDIPEWDIHWNKNPSAHSYIPFIKNINHKNLLFGWMSSKFNVPRDNIENAISTSCTLLKGLDSKMDEKYVSEMLSSVFPDRYEQLLTLFQKTKSFSKFINHINPLLYSDIIKWLVKIFNSNDLTSFGCCCSIPPVVKLPQPNHSFSVDQLRSMPKIGQGIRSYDHLKSIMGEK
jgi:hypothetical protein